MACRVVPSLASRNRCRGHLAGVPVVSRRSQRAAHSIRRLTYLSHEYDLSKALDRTELGLGVASQAQGTPEQVWVVLVQPGDFPLIERHATLVTV